VRFAHARVRVRSEGWTVCAAQGANLRALKRGGAGKKGLQAGPGRCAGAASLLLRPRR